MSLTLLYGRKVQRVGRRLFAVQKPHSLTERIHAHTLSSGTLPKWQRVMTSPVSSHVICNQKRADGRRTSMWSRKVTPALFAGRT